MHHADQTFDGSHSATSIGFGEPQTSTAPSFGVPPSPAPTGPTGPTSRVHFTSTASAVCSAALRKLGVRVDIEAQPPKLGPLIDAINAALSDPRRLGKS